tara:strand:- start:442 stop:609 length:168 start_codon:yes stop_codon:yes gene_type:complete
MEDISQSDYEYVNLIMRDASKYHLELEVRLMAIKYVNEGYEYVESYRMAYNDWVK